ncbi:MAG: hypothetical protein CFH39_00505 [Alphaproteobacteria bacterium MarineAlpha10_Bin2]|nr:MAG: hypothetical protein CFH39_00505 [Alphaproteobacteria bacterium MarineAlpha10_Bin2]
MFSRCLVVAVAILLAAIPGAAHVIFPGLGHIMLEEDPDATLDALRDFLVPLQS